MWMGPWRPSPGRGLGARLLVGAAQRLAIDCDDLGRHSSQPRHPGDEAALEHLGVERREDVPEVIMGGRSIAERPEAAQQPELLLAEPRDIDERFRSGQHREQAQQQHLLQRVDHLSALTRVRQILEVIEKHDRFAEHAAVARRIVHRHPPRDRIEGPTQIQRFGTLSRTSSPDCSALEATVP
jgi:hypothetical protein